MSVSCDFMDLNEGTKNNCKRGDYLEISNGDDVDEM